MSRPFAAEPFVAPEPLDAGQAAWLRRRVLAWFDRCGHRDLPWRLERDPWRVWVAEIMLQQTSVAAVMPYYRRFLDAFPDVAALACASEDEALRHWSGLGYYARARNLHRAARLVHADRGGRLPDTVDGLMALPGIGRSTAGAIAAAAFGRAAPVLDGNVKRALSRYLGITAWPGRAAVSRVLWQCAGACTPRRRAADYNQAMMDLGATVCTRARARCAECPLSRRCAARRLGIQARCPGRRPARPRPRRGARLAVILNRREEALLSRRPSPGVWGGLWCFPELPAERDADAWFEKRWKPALEPVRTLPEQRHQFTHFELSAALEVFRLVARGPVPAIGGRWRWWHPGARAPGGLAAPVRRCLDLWSTMSSPRRPTRRRARAMGETVFCKKYRREMEKLDAPPFPGPRGLAIQQTVSKQAWEDWKAHQTRLINERRLNMMDPESRTFLQREMDRFLSGENYAAVEGYVPEAPEAPEEDGR